MIQVLVAALVVLVGGQLRLRPRSRLVHAPEPAAVDPPSADRPRKVGLPRLALRRASQPTALPPEDVAAWCDALTRAVSTGSTLTAAVREVEPPASCAGAVDSIRLALRRGLSLSDACAVPAASRHLDAALTVLQACATHGGPAAEPLSRAAAVLRGRAADVAERRTHSAQARLSAVVMTAVPMCMLALLVLTSGSVRHVVASPLGVGIVLLGAGLNLLGWRWMRHLIDGPRP